MFQLVQRLDLDTCFRCRAKITTVAELSLDHVKDWLHTDRALFWDLENIRFSHLACNIAAQRGQRITSTGELAVAPGYCRGGCGRRKRKAAFAKNRRMCAVCYRKHKAELQARRRTREEAHKERKGWEGRRKISPEAYARILDRLAHAAQPSVVAVEFNVSVTRIRAIKRSAGVTMPKTVVPAAAHRKLVNWPPFEELRRMREHMSLSEIALRLGASDTSVRKRLAQPSCTISSVDVG